MFFGAKTGGKFGGNHSDQRRISAAHDGLAPEHLCPIASRSDSQRTPMNAVLEAAA